MDIDIVTNTETVIPQIFSVVTCICLFVSFGFIPKKTLGLTMILILAISDFILHCMLLLLSYKYNDTSQVIKVTFNVALRFSIFWSSNMAITVYKSLTEGHRTTVGYIATSASIIVAVSLICSLM